MRLHLRLACAAGTLVAWSQFIALAIAAEPNPHPSPSTAAARESFRFKPSDPWLLVPVHVGDKDYPFILDTGATGTVFDLSLRPRLGRPVRTLRATTPGGEVSIDLFSPPDARVGSLAFAGSPVACQDLSKAQAMSGYGFQGILGMHFLRNWIVSIDFDEGRVDFLSPGTPAKPEWGESLPFKYDPNGMMVVAATAGTDTPASFIIDTGQRESGLLVDSLFSHLVNSHQLRVTGRGNMVGLGGTQRSQMGVLSRLSVGPFQQDNLRVNSGYKNLLGLDYLRRYRVTIDFANRRLYLAKGKKYAATARGAMSVPSAAPGTAPSVAIVQAAAN